MRQGNERSFVVTLRNKEGNTTVIKTPATLSLLGATFDEVSGEEKSNLGISGGAKITKLNPGRLRSVGIKEGFIITSVDKKPIRSMNDLESALKDKQGGVLIEGVYPNGMKSYYGFGM